MYYVNIKLRKNKLLKVHYSMELLDQMREVIRKKTLFDSIFWKKVGNLSMFSFKQQRRDRLSAFPLPQSWLKIIGRNVPFYHCLPEADQRELQDHIQVFLDEKHFEGCRGLQVTDEIRLTIAAQACLLLLHRDTDYYLGARAWHRVCAFTTRCRTWSADGIR